MCFRRFPSFTFLSISKVLSILCNLSNSPYTFDCATIVTELYLICSQIVCIHEEINTLPGIEVRF